jgi:hypothetical protein
MVDSMDDQWVGSLENMLAVHLAGKKVFSRVEYWGDRWVSWKAAY